MYDMEFIMPVCCKPKRFLDRVNAFKQYGLLNLGDYKITITLLVGTHDIPNVFDNWPCDVTVVKQELDHPAPKIYGYFASLEPGYTDRARWFFKLDDDSITNVGGLIEQLDRDYNYQSPFYLIVDGAQDLWGPYKSVLAQMDLEEQFFPKTSHGKWTYLHEWEGCVISQRALNMMIKNETGKEFLRNIATIDGGWGDHALAVAARLSNIHPLEVPFMTKDPAYGDLSVFGGRHHHIHYIAPDKTNEWAGFINRYIVSRQKVDDTHDKKKRRTHGEVVDVKPITPRDNKTPNRQKPVPVPQNIHLVQDGVRIKVKPRQGGREPDKFQKRLRRRYNIK